MQTPTAIDSRNLKPTHESIDLMTLIPTVKPMLKQTDSLKQRCSLKRIEIEKSPCSMIDCEIDSLDRIHLPMLIGLVKPTNFASEPSSAIDSMKHSADPIRSVIASYLRTD